MNFILCREHANKMGKGIATNRSAAGLRRSAIAERLRLREEWSSLKGTEDEAAKVTKKRNVFSKHLHNTKERSPSQEVPLKITFQKDKENTKPRQSSLDPLRGVVALVDIGSENRALALRAALAALGATVVPAWSPLVTHLVWAQGGCRVTRAKARGLACFVVSPLWVEACAASARRVSEKVFPSTARASDLPSPATLCRLLKRAEKENWQLTDLLSDQDDSSEGRPGRLRISSDTDDNTKNKTADTTHESIDIENRVNTALRRALPASISPVPANPKSRRKLFTARPDGEDTDESDAENTPTRGTKAKRPEVGVFRPRPNKDPTRPEKPPKRPEKAVTAPERQKKNYNLTQEQKKNLEKAERIAKRLAAQPALNKKIQKTQTQRKKISKTPRIVLTGMPKSQYRAVVAAIQSLNGKIQKHVNHKTTHVLLGTCKEDSININAEIHPDRPDTEANRSKDRINVSVNKPPSKEISICNQCNDPQDVIIQVLENDNVTVTNHCTQTTALDKDVTVICSKKGCNALSSNSFRNNQSVTCENPFESDANGVNNNVNNGDHNISDLCEGIVNDKRLRTLKALLGAARGCRVLHAQWALDSQREKQWQHHMGYEVTYLLKIAQKAYIERTALGELDPDYAYDVFRGMQVCVSERADQREAALKLLSLCGAEVVDHSQNAQGFDTPQDGRPTQNGGRIGTQQQNGPECVVRIGKDDDEVSSKWVFDSVAAARPRTTRRYINRNIPK